MLPSPSHQYSATCSWHSRAAAWRTSSTAVEPRSAVAQSSQKGSKTCAQPVSHDCGPPVSHDCGPPPAQSAAGPSQHAAFTAAVRASRSHANAEPCARRWPPPTPSAAPVLTWQVPPFRHGHVAQGPHVGGALAESCQLPVSQTQLTVARKLVRRFTPSDTSITYTALPGISMGSVSGRSSWKMALSSSFRSSSAYSRRLSLAFWSSVSSSNSRTRLPWDAPTLMVAKDWPLPMVGNSSKPSTSTAPHVRMVGRLLSASRNVVCALPTSPPVSSRATAAAAAAASAAPRDPNHVGERTSSPSQLAATRRTTSAQPRVVTAVGTSASTSSGKCSPSSEHASRTQFRLSSSSASLSQLVVAVWARAASTHRRTRSANNSAPDSIFSTAIPAGRRRCSLAALRRRSRRRPQPPGPPASNPSPPVSSAAAAGSAAVLTRSRDRGKMPLKRNEQKPRTTNRSAVQIPNQEF
jgi:hypothetical protein